MVEGPGCKLNGEKLRRRGKGQVVKAVSGTAVEKSMKAKSETSAYDILVGMKLTDILTLGKELFIIFEDDICVRVHFLMAGCLRFNDENKEFGSTKTETPRLKLTMNRDVVQFFGTSVEIRSSAECQQKYRDLIDLDILSPTFNTKKATQIIMGQPERLVCDVILDQMVLPGVGNIIKNEALFNAGINPNSKVSQLNEELVTLLVTMNRDFTKIFYMCRKEGKNLNKYMNVYKKGKCVECGTKLVQCKIGEYERLTYFCPACQNNTIRSKTKLPKRSSLLGWVVGVKDQVSWSCSVCTLVNKPANVKCNACLTPKVPQSSASLISNSKGINITTNPSSSACCLSTSATSSLKQISPDRTKRTVDDDRSSIVSTKGKYKFRKLEKVSEESHELNSLRYKDTLPLSEQTIHRIPSIKGSSKEKGGESSDMHSEVVLCLCHKTIAKKCKVVKDNDNKGRIFYTCSKPASSKCNFFMWGDSHHPLCGHGKVSIIRSVLKQNSNNGREFYCCKLPKKKQCDFFQWVDGK